MEGIPLSPRASQEISAACLSRTAHPAGLGRQYPGTAARVGSRQPVTDKQSGEPVAVFPGVSELHLRAGRKPVGHPGERRERAEIRVLDASLSDEMVAVMEGLEEDDLERIGLWTPSS